MKFEYSNASGNTVSIEPTAQDLSYLLGLLPWKREDFLDYSLTEVAKHYNIPWIKISTRKGEISAPYQMIHDYGQPTQKSNWGTAKISSDFEFPSALIPHRSKMVEIFEKKGLLKKGNSSCPRVASFQLLNSVPQFDLQLASYFDQVGTNLTLDYRLAAPLISNANACSTVREWDISQAQVQYGSLPSFKQSQLANTIGVSIGITAHTKDGKKVILKRKRSSKVAVYANTWSTPFGFALALEQDAVRNKVLPIEDLIRRDYNHEFAEELGLQFLDFTPPRPIAFCRDLLRGGKPQFFLEAEALIPFEELRKKLQDHSNEYSSRIKITHEKDSTTKIDTRVSPEYKCFLILASLKEDVNTI